jgi:hypothetical protein
MTTACVEPQPIFDSLIAGLGVASCKLDPKCKAALRAVGGRAVPYLHAAAAEASPRRRKQIETLAATISEDQDSSPDAGHLVPEALVTAVIVQTDRADTSLIPAIRSLGPAFVDILVQEAVIHFRRAAVCLRILRVIEQLGDPSQPLAQMDLFILTASKSEAVRELALKLFCDMRHKPRAVEADALA